MYGGSGTGGILNYVTKLPTAQQFGEVSISGGSFNRYQGQFGMGGPANKDGTVLWRLTGILARRNPGRLHQGQPRLHRARVTFKPNEDTTITVLTTHHPRPACCLYFLPALGSVS